jgi:hypothetical protein
MFLFTSVKFTDSSAVSNLLMNSLKAIFIFWYNLSFLAFFLILSYSFCLSTGSIWFYRLFIFYFNESLSNSNHGYFEFLFLCMCWMEVYCGIYKGSCNISNILYFNFLWHNFNIIFLYLSLILILAWVFFFCCLLSWRDVYSCLLACLVNVIETGLLVAYVYRVSATEERSLYYDDLHSSG